MLTRREFLKSSTLSISAILFSEISLITKKVEPQTKTKLSSHYIYDSLRKELDSAIYDVRMNEFLHEPRRLRIFVTTRSLDFLLQGSRRDKLLKEPRKPTQYNGLVLEEKNIPNKIMFAVAISDYFGWETKISCSIGEDGAVKDYWNYYDSNKINLRSA